MRYLLDTHIVIWLFGDKDSINKDVINIIEDYENTLYISVATLHEIVIKTRNAGLKLQKSFADFEKSLDIDFGIKIINLEPKHIRHLNNLTFFNGHNDPFDHIIISQALCERMHLISADSKFPFYTKQGLKLISN